MLSHWGQKERANMPSDWNSWYSKCGRCGSRYHDSEGGCGCLDDYQECAAHGSSQFVKGYGKRPGRMVSIDCYVHVDDELVEVGDQSFCQDHALCEACGEHNDTSPLVDYEGSAYCAQCASEEAEEAVA